MKKIVSVLAVALFAIMGTGKAHAEPLGGQVFYSIGGAWLEHGRGGQVFTDTNGLSGKNDGTSGYDLSAGFDIPLVKQAGPGTVLGEFMVDYSRFSGKKVLQTTSVLGLPGVPATTENITVSELSVVFAPKYRFEGIMGGRLRPWIIPAGVAFLINSPPSNNTTYVDIGYHVAAGVEYMLLDQLSVGVDYRYTIASGEPGLKSNYSVAQLYFGINF